MQQTGAHDPPFDCQWCAAEGRKTRNWVTTNVTAKDWFSRGMSSTHLRRSRCHECGYVVFSERAADRE